MGGGSHPWNTVVGSPEVASSSLNGVDCVSATDCWAVGYTGVLGGHPTSLIENYNGTIWSLVAIVPPSPAAPPISPG